MSILEDLAWMRRMEERAKEIGWGAAVREHLRALEERAWERETAWDQRRADTSD